MNYSPDTIVKSCRKLESGLRLGNFEGIHACELGPFSSPRYWTSAEASNLKITKEMIVEKRRWIFEMLNDDHSDTPCKHCKMVYEKRYRDVDFTRLGHIDLAATTICNLRCNFCAYTKYDVFTEAQYDALAILRVFSPEDVEWDSAVDFNGGEPTLLPNLKDYLDYFNSRRTRIFLYTNAVKFSQSVYDNLANGSIRWVCTSLDCGTPSSFLRIKARNYFSQVMDTLTRYANAGNKGGGSLAVKYIFCEDNCDDDDVYGFVYAMLAIRPQKIWLTFDFEPLKGLPGDSTDFGGRDYSKHIEAYAKMYRLLEKHGIEAEHFAKRHLAVVSVHGRMFLEKALARIEELRRSDPPTPQELNLPDFRRKDVSAPVKPTLFSLSPLRISRPGQTCQTWNLQGKRIVLVPACAAAINLLSDPELKKAEVIAFADRDQVLHGKSIKGVRIHPYEELKDLAPDAILVAAPEIHRDDILRMLASHIDPSLIASIN